MKWYIKAFEHYADFKGRASRKEFWMFCLFQTIIYVCLFFIIRLNYNIGMIISTLYHWGSLLPALAVTVRRLHDANKSSIWIWEPFTLGVLFCVVAHYYSDLSAHITGFGFFCITFVIILLLFCLKKSQSGVNEWGANPNEHNTLVTSRVMEAEAISKNGASLKSLTSRGNMNCNVR
jgi:uncharacterized membrane protein YhaH (DUF805 family)